MERVPDDGVVIRLIPPSQFDAGRIELSNLPRKEFRPKSQDSGPSFYVMSKLPDGIRTLEEAEPKWAQYGYVEIPVGELSRIGMELRYTLKECPFELLKVSHASLTTPFDGSQRGELIELMNRHLVRQPASM